jgi:dTDP-4-dehydrorhamnose reductase
MRPAPPGTRGFGLDVRDEAAVAAALAETRPDAVLHTAYVQHGDEARSVNVEGAPRSRAPRILDALG